jgi:hypothetical protein
MPDQQPGYRAYHLTEIEVLQVTADIFRVVDDGDLAILVWTDLSLAFDTVDHAYYFKDWTKSFGFVAL